MATDLATVLQERDQAIARANDLEIRLKAAEQKNADISPALIAAGAERDGLRIRVTKLEGDVTAANQKAADLEAREADLEKRVTARVATLGIGKGAVPPGAGPGGAHADVLDEYNAMKEGPDKRAFLKAHGNELLALQRAKTPQPAQAT
jgi:DNA repair exonuclease SbcCD ATPase subunit